MNTETTIGYEISQLTVGEPHPLFDTLPADQVRITCTPDYGTVLNIFSQYDGETLDLLGLLNGALRIGVIPLDGGCLWRVKFDGDRQLFDAAWRPEPDLCRYVLGLPPMGSGIASWDEMTSAGEVRIAIVDGGLVLRGIRHIELEPPFQRCLGRLYKDPRVSHPDWTIYPDYWWSQHVEEARTSFLGYGDFARASVQQRVGADPARTHGRR